MGLFDFFKKKNTDLPKEQNVDPRVSKNVYLIETLQLKLVDMGYQVERHPQYWALIINSEVELATVIIEEPGAHPSVMHLLVSASHAKYFPAGIIENVAGVGHTIEDQVNSVLNNYINSTFTTIMDGFSDTHDPDTDLYVNTNGTEILWHPKLGSLNIQGQWAEHPQNEPFFELLKDKIPRMLTDNKINWLKVYISKRADGEIIGECLFNNEPWEEALNSIYNYADSWEMPGEFKGLKQFIVFRRCDAYDHLIRS